MTKYNPLFLSLGNSWTLILQLRTTFFPWLG